MVSEEALFVILCLFETYFSDPCNVKCSICKEYLYIQFEPWLRKSHLHLTSHSI